MDSPAVTYVPPELRKDRRSDLVKAKEKNTLGEKLNFCPFECSLEELDDNGYCHHLIGFTSPGNEKEYQPMRKNELGRLQVYGAEKELVKKGDKLVRITVSSRVYRDVPKLEQA